MKVGILGAGKIAAWMGRTLAGLEGACAYGVASRDLQRAKAFGERYGVEKIYGSYEEMLEDKEVDLVYIATPHSHHFEHMKLCIEYGKNILCEKAFTANGEQAKEIFALAEAKGIFVTEAMWIRYMPSCRIIQEAVESGIIGEVTSLTANLGYELRNIPRLQEPALAGGALLDLGVYTINFARMVFGEDIREITSACTKLETGVDSQHMITLTYGDGRMAVLNATMLAQTDRRGIINGTKGYIQVENINNPEKILVYNLERRLVKSYEIPAQITGYEYEVMAAQKAIWDGKTECSEMPHQETIHIMEMMDELRRRWGIVYPFEGKN